jgi:hypothetical protein
MYTREFFNCFNYYYYLPHPQYIQTPLGPDNIIIHLYKKYTVHQQQRIVPQVGDEAFQPLAQNQHTTVERYHASTSKYSFPTQVMKHINHWLNQHTTTQKDIVHQHQCIVSQPGDGAYQPLAQKQHTTTQKDIVHQHQSIISKQVMKHINH